MFFLLRTAFWLSVVLALLPSGQSQPQSKGPGAVEAVSAAGAAMSDVSHFCERQPDTCVVGTQAAVAFGQRAQAGARMVYDFINEKVATPADTGSVKAIAVRTPPAKTQAVAGKPSQHTLTPADLKPAYRAPRKDAQGAQAKRV